VTTTSAHVGAANEPSCVTTISAHVGAANEPPVP